MHIRKLKCRRRGKYCVLHLLRILDSLIVLWTLGHYATDFYEDFLFSDWSDDIDYTKSSNRG